jgi:hypothetical protein
MAKKKADPAAEKLMTDFMKQYEKEQKTKYEIAQKNISELADELFMNLVYSVEAEYNGEGDSGDITYVGFYDVNGENIDYKLSPEKREKLADACFAFLPGGFEINDGGYGTVKIKLADRSIVVEHNARIVEIASDKHTYSF